MGHALPCSTTDHTPKHCASAESSIQFTWFDYGSIPRAGLVHALAQTHCPSSPCLLPSLKPAIQSEIWPHGGIFCTLPSYSEERVDAGTGSRGWGAQMKRMVWGTTTPRFRPFIAALRSKGNSVSLFNWLQAGGNKPFVFPLNSHFCMEWGCSQTNHQTCCRV